MEMSYRSLGDSGLVVSRVGLGCNNFGGRIDGEQSNAVVDEALDLGVNFFDTSDSYGASEEVLGSALEGRRDRAIVATKFGSDLNGANGPDWGARTSRRYVRRAVERSLRRLRTDWIDLYQLHRPDGITPLEEVLSTLSDLVREGKIRYIGSSNLSGWQVSDADWLARTTGQPRFISAQNQYNVLDRQIEQDVIPACAHHRVSILPYFPLANGLLTGKYRRGEQPAEGTRLATWTFTNELTDARFDVVEQLEQLARDRSISLVQLAIGWLCAQPTVGSVIAGATKPEQMRANVAAVSWTPSSEDLEAIDKICAQPAGV